jgi:hypothetical protein
MTSVASDLAAADALARRAWHPVGLLLVLALWLSTLGNWPLWRALWDLTETLSLRTVLGLLGFGLIVLAATTALLSLLVWPRWRKPVGVLLLLVAAANSYFMHTYGIVIDPSMMANTVQTDVREVRDLLSWSLLAVLALGVVLPGWWWWRQPVQKLPVRRMLGRQMGLAGLALLLMLVVVWVSFQDLASTMRNQKSLRYMINPFNTIYASTRLVLGQTAQASLPLQPIAEDAALVRASAAGQPPPLIVLVVGETVRAANFGLAGYARNTTPQLRQLQGRGELAYFAQVTSCGTNTQVSVPCMFSHLGRDGHAKNSTPYENLLDVLQRAGLQVLWLDNQSGCKGVCDRVPNVSTRELKDPALARALGPAGKSRGLCLGGHGGRAAPDGQPRPGLLQTHAGRGEGLPARMPQQCAAGLSGPGDRQCLRQRGALHRSPVGANRALAPGPAPSHGPAVCVRPWRIAGRERPVPARHALHDGTPGANPCAHGAVAVKTHAVPIGLGRRLLAEKGGRTRLARPFLPFGPDAGTGQDPLAQARTGCVFGLRTASNLNVYRPAGQLRPTTIATRLTARPPHTAAS